MYSDLALAIGEIQVAPAPLGGTLVLAYLLGSVPFGLLLTRLAGLGDVRKIGSGNIGATNVLRTGRRDIALVTLILDGGKGAVAVLLAYEMFGPSASALAAIGAFLGHLFPIYLGFRGGKGVATFLGIALAAHFWVGLLACGTWLLVAAVTRYSSLAALVATAATPVYAYFFSHYLEMEQGVVLAALVYLKHRQNMKRLATGEEPKIGQGKPAS
jgi:glycerol-3-phosphate acyltransferase PlsY